MKKSRKYSLLGTTLLSSSLLISSCNGTGGGSQQSNNVIPDDKSIKSPLTIDNSGVIPAFHGTPVTTNLFVHNNSNYPIQNVEFSYEANTESASGSRTESMPGGSPILSYKNCINFAANGKCALQITIPALTDNANGGSMLITMKYRLNNAQHSFSQPVNFAAASTAKPGVYVSMASHASIFDNSGVNAYTTNYIYGSGETGKSYKIKTLKPDAILGTISEGKLAGTSIHPRMVEAIELETAKVTGTGIGSLQVEVTDEASGKSYSGIALSTVVLGSSTGSGKAVVAGSIVPKINIAKNATGSIYIYNKGTKSAAISVETSPEITLLTNAPAVLEAGTAAKIAFKITATKKGNGSIKVINGKDTSKAEISWYNSTTDKEYLRTEVSPPVPDSGYFLNTQESLQVDVTVTNKTGSALSGINSTATTTSGTGTFTISDSSTPCKQLAIDGECSFSGLLTSHTVETGSIALQQSATKPAANTDPITNTTVLNYTAVSNPAQLAISMAPASLSIKGDGKHAESAIITITNTGNSPTKSPVKLSSNLEDVKGTIKSAQLIDADKPCTSALGAGDSCKAAFQIGTEITKLKLESSIIYTASADGAESATATATLTVLPANISLDLAGIPQIQGGTGVGTTNDPVKYQAGNVATKTVTFAYKNTGETILNIANISTPTSNYWTSKDDCTGKTLQINDTCSITLTNTIDENGDSQTKTTLDIPFPTLTTKEAGQIQPTTDNYPDRKLYANNYQAVITNTAFESLGARTFVVAHTVSGYEDGGYGSGFVLATAIDTAGTPVLSGAGVDKNCSPTPMPDGLNEICYVNATNKTFTSNYAIDRSEPEYGAIMHFNYFINQWQLKGGPWVWLTGSSGQNGRNEAFDSFKYRGDDHYLLWISSSTHTGDLGGFAGADQLCQQDSNNPDKEHPARSSAYLSGGTIYGHLKSGAPVYRADGATLIAKVTTAGLIPDTLQAAISTDCSYTKCTIWTGAAQDHGIHQCDGGKGPWTSGDGVATMLGGSGAANSTMSDWFRYNVQNCNGTNSSEQNATPLALYCITTKSASTPKE